MYDTNKILNLTKESYTTRGKMEMKHVKRKFWKTGKGVYITSFPVEWVEDFVKRFKEDIIILFDGDKFFILPILDERTIELEIDLDDYAGTKMKIVSAFLKGYDRVKMFFNRHVTQEEVNKLCEFVPGALGKRVGANEGEIFFTERVYEAPLGEILVDVRRVFQELSEDVLDAFRAFPDRNNIVEIKNRRLNEKEKRLDEILFYIRRVSSNPLVYEKIGVSIEEVTILSPLFSNIERLGDLHKEIVERLEKIANIVDRLLDLEDFSCFLDYYKLAYETIITSIDSVENPEKGLEIIRGKLSRWVSYRDGALIKAKERMKEYIFSQRDPEIIRHLTILEGKERAIPDIASNICEFAYNMRGLSKSVK